MDDEYEVKSTSDQSANVADIVLVEADTTRRILRAQLVENPHDPRATVRMCILHQRRTKSQEWEDFPKSDLRKLKAGEEACFLLHTKETLRLYEELQKLYEIGREGVSIGRKKYFFFGIDGEQAEKLDLRSVINHLIDQGQEFWDAVKELDPDILRKLKDADPDSFERFVQNELFESRKAALACFREHMELNDWDERAWAGFFQDNKWIFGYGLSYRFLNLMHAQPHYGGVRVDGSGTQIGDYMAVTAGNARFIVLVEIKRPDTQLILEKYRVRAHNISKGLGGAVAQVQSDCDMWTKQSEAGPNVRELEGQGIYTCQPKGIVVIGDTKEFGQKDKDGTEQYDRMMTFERFRRNLQNPEILTYDELLARAEYIVGAGNDGPVEDGGGKAEVALKQAEPPPVEKEKAFEHGIDPIDPWLEELEIEKPAKPAEASPHVANMELDDPFADE